MLFLLLLFLCSGIECLGQKSPNVKKVISYEKAGKGFYKGSDNKLYIKTRRLISPPEKYGPYFYREVHVVDISSYEDYGNYDGYAKDKAHVYWRRGTTDGNFIDIVEKADPLTFRIDSLAWLGSDSRFYFDHGKYAGKK